MSLAALKISLAYWKRKAAYRQAKWKDAHKRHSSDVHKWWGPWHEALANIDRRAAQIAAKQPAYLSTVSVMLPPSMSTFEGGQSKDGLFHPYWDSDGGVWTIGFGHTENVSSKSRALTRSEAYALLRHDMNVKYAPAVTRALKAFGWKHVGQKTFDALADFCYNLGAGYFSAASSVGGAMKRHDLGAVANAMLLYDKAGGQRLAGLTRRRRWEAQLARGGTYAVDG